ncbi:hypothetical protein ACIO3O_33030 [Streptomyces sp. NPDC087440]|uniref:hypothetical protein n=1 Tax=Streptomyces sp. NPDC087440 TaxID=3365790 RepID=UPI0037F9E6D2
MHRGGGLGEGTDDLGPERARRGRHRRRERAARTEASEAPDAASVADAPGSGARRADGLAHSVDGLAHSVDGPAHSADGLAHSADGLAHGPRTGHDSLAGLSTGSKSSGTGSRAGRVGVTYKYFGAPNGATAARVPISMRPEELGGDELGMGGMFTKIKPETMAAMVLTGIQGIPLHKVPPLELVVLHPDYAVVKLPMTVVDPLRGIGEESVGAAAFIWSTVPDRGGPSDAFNVYQLLHEWQDFSHRLHEAGHQAYCLVWP